MPVFSGGEKAMINYILMNTIYPEAAVKDSVEGKIVSRFTIDTDGSTGDFVIIKSVRDDLDNECIRVIKEMPAWKPGST
jgi:TonB family protein